jgi:hypothetical protein
MTRHRSRQVPKDIPGPGRTNQKPSPVKTIIEEIRIYLYICKRDIMYLLRIKERQQEWDEYKDFVDQHFPPGR